MAWLSFTNQHRAVYPAMRDFARFKSNMAALVEAHRGTFDANDTHVLFSFDKADQTVCRYYPKTDTAFDALFGLVDMATCHLWPKDMFEGILVAFFNWAPPERSCSPSDFTSLEELDRYVQLALQGGISPGLCRDIERETTKRMGGILAASVAPATPPVKVQHSAQEQLFTHARLHAFVRSRDARVREEFGHTLREKRAEAGLSPVNAAHSLRISAATIHRWESGNYPTSQSMPFVAYCKLVRITDEDLKLK